MTENEAGEVRKQFIAELRKEMVKAKLGIALKDTFEYIIGEALITVLCQSPLSTDDINPNDWAKEQGL